MPRLVERVMSLLRPPEQRAIPSTKDELKVAHAERRHLKRRTQRLALILADYRKQDGALNR